MSTLQAGGIDVSAQLIYSPITITERTPTSAPPPHNKIAVLEMDWKAQRSTLIEWKLAEVKFQKEKE